MITVHDLGRQGAIWRTYGDGKKSFTFAELWKALIHIGRVDPEADIEEPEHLGKKRLPIAGESASDWHRKLLFYTGEFGRWLCSQKRRSTYEDVISLVEQELNPYGATPEDVFQILIPRPWDWSEQSRELRLNMRAAGNTRLALYQGPDGEELNDDEPYEDWPSMFLGERGFDLDEVTEDIGQAYTEWLRECGCGLHTCHVEVDPIQPWPTDAGVYFVLAGDRIKIGKAVNVAKRLSGLQTSAPYKLHLLAVAPGGLDEEGAYHDRFIKWRRQGEWFDIAQPLLDEVRALRKAAGK